MEIQLFGSLQLITMILGNFLLTYQKSLKLKLGGFVKGPLTVHTVHMIKKHYYYARMSNYN